MTPTERAGRDGGSLWRLGAEALQDCPSASQLRGGQPRRGLIHYVTILTQPLLVFTVGIYANEAITMFIITVMG